MPGPQVKPDSDPESTELAPPLELNPCDAAAMAAFDHPEPDLVLEMEHLGRGTHFYDEEVRGLPRTILAIFCLHHVVHIVDTQDQT